jgi:hypothetical protein
VTALKASLFILGALVEFLGILGVAAPDLVPYRDRLSAWLAARYITIRGRITGALRRLLRRPVYGSAHSVLPAGGIEMAGRVSVRKQVAEGASLGVKVDFLLARDQEAQRDMDEVRARLAEFERESEARLVAARAEIEDRFARDLTAALAAYRPIRALGALALAVGLVMVTAANFVG